MMKQQQFAFAAIIIVAAFLRFVQLGSVPYGINQDEADRAYEAYSLLKTGHDQHGVPWPLTLEAFSRAHDNASAIHAYATIPFVAMLGPGVVATRLPAAIAGVLLVWATVILGKRLSGNWNIGLLAGAVLAVSPWHLTLSRTGHEAVWLPTLFSLGAVAYFSALDKRPWLMPLAVLAWGVGFFGYGPGKLFFPVAALVILGFTFRRIRWRHPATRVAIAVVGVLFVLLFTLSTGQLGAGRFNEISIFQTGITSGIRQLGINILSYVNPVSWFLGYISVGPLDWLIFLIGVPFFFLLARANQALPRFRTIMLGWLVAALLPAILTDANPHQLRAGGLLSFLYIAGAWGFTLMVRPFVTRLQQFHWKLIGITSAVVLGAVGLALFVSPSYFIRAGYGQPYSYTPEMPRVVALLKGLQASEVRIVDDHLNQPSIFLMLLIPWDPATVQSDTKVEQLPNGWNRTTRLGRYTFCQFEECVTSTSGVAFLEVANETQLGKRLVERIPIQGFSKPLNWTISIND